MSGQRCACHGAYYCTVAGAGLLGYDYDAVDADMPPLELARRRVQSFVEMWGDGEPVEGLHTRDLAALLMELDRSEEGATPMAACNDCWDEAFRRSQVGGGHQAEHYEAILLLPAHERPWCAFTRTMTREGTADD